MKVRKSLVRLASAGVGTAAALAMVSATSQAQAADDPIPAADFADCPALLPNHVALGSFCFNAVVTSGQLKVGSLDQNITKPIRLTWGSQWNPDTEEHRIVFGQMKADKMLVRPGIFGDPILTAVYAKPEWAGVFEADGFDIKISMRLRLTNPFLGGSCVVTPMVLNLTTGTTNPPPPNGPISGSPPVLVPGQPVSTRKLTSVDNAFSVPGANHCALNIGIVNAIVNSQAGLPSAAGKNTAIFNEYAFTKSYAQLP